MVTQGKKAVLLGDKELCQKITLSRYKVSEVHFTAIVIKLYLFTKAVLWICKSKLVRQWVRILHSY